MPIQTVAVPVPEPFELRLCLHGHGWVALAPHAYDEAESVFRTALRAAGQVVDCELRQERATHLVLRVASAARLRAAELAVVHQQIRHMLRLDCDLAPFHALCRSSPALAWVARRGAGRLLRSAAVFEDLLKLLCTTNTSWAGTVAMVHNLVQALGDPAPSGRRAFPTAEQCCRDEAFWREVVRVGYRATAARELAAGFATGRLTAAQFLAAPSAAELWQRLMQLRGFGPYAAGQAMRLLGHYEALALDSWCRAELATRNPSGRAPSDAAVARRYAPFAPYQGLALWLDLTARWHGERNALPLVAPTVTAAVRAPVRAPHTAPTSRLRRAPRAADRMRNGRRSRGR